MLLLRPGGRGGAGSSQDPPPHAGGIQKALQPSQPHRGADPGHHRMLDESAYCPDILTQAAAANAALNAFSRELLSQHIRSCVVNDLHEGHDEVVDELLDTLGKMMK